MGNRKNVQATLATLLLMVSLTLPALQVQASPSVTVDLSQDSGPIGVTVTVSGQLENPGAQFKIFWHYIKDWDGRYGFLASGYAEGYDYTASITIPPAFAGDHYVIVEDEKNHATGYAIFTVTPEIAVQPDTAPSGAIVAVSGQLVNNETITIKFYDHVDDSEVEVAQATTDPVNGSFSCTFKVPLKPEGDYNVRAYWNALLQAEASFHIGYEGITVNPNKAPPYAVVAVSGGLAINETFTVAFTNGTWSVDVATVQTDGSGHFATNVTVPSASPGDYSVIAYNDGVSIDALFQILPPAAITVQSDSLVDPSQSVAGFSILTVSGQNFIAGESVSVYFESAPILMAETTVDPDGTFAVQFKVPEGAAAGTHNVIAQQDPFNVSASAQIVVHRVEISPCSMVYVQGDLISFNVNSTTPFATNSLIAFNVVDERGVPFASNAVNSTSVVSIGSCYLLPYSVAMLPPPIPKGLMGIWSWDVSYYLELYPKVERKASCIFYVIVDPDVYSIIQKLNDLDVKIAGVVQKQDELYLLVQQNHNYVMARLDELQGALMDVTLDGFAVIETALGEVKLKLDALNMVATEIRNDVVVIQSNLGMLTAKLDTVNATLAGLITNVKGEILAKIDTAFGTVASKLDDLEAQIIGVKGGVATIQTALGTMQTSLSGLDAKITAINETLITIDTKAGTVVAKLDAINATVISLITIAEGEIVAKIDTAVGAVTAKLSDLNAKLVAINGTMVTIQTDVGTISAKLDDMDAKLVAINGSLAVVDTKVGEVKVGLDQLNATITQLFFEQGEAMVRLETLLGNVTASLNDLGGHIVSIDDNVAKIVVPGLGELKVAVASAESASKESTSTVAGISTLMYAVIILSLVSAVLAGVCFVYLRRKS